MAESLSPFIQERENRPSFFEQSQIQIENILDRERAGNATGQDLLDKRGILQDRENKANTFRRLGGFELADERLAGVLEAALEGTTRPLPYLAELTREDSLAREVEADTWRERRFRSNPDLPQDSYRGIAGVYVAHALEDIQDVVRGQAPPAHESWQWDVRQASRAIDEAREAAEVAEPEPAPAAPPPAPGRPDYDPYNEERFQSWNDPEAEAVPHGRSFSIRWTRSHGLPDALLSGAGRGAVPRKMFADEILSGYALTANPILSRGVEPLILASREPEFANAAISGLIPLLVLDREMRISRLKEVVEAITKSGPRPEGVAAWLKADKETTRCLRLFYMFSGYDVAPEQGFEDRVDGWNPRTRMLEGTEHRFNDVIKGETYEGKPINDRPTTISHTERVAYLNAIQTTVGTDPALVRVAYTIYRLMGNPNENGKFLELFNKYLFTQENPNGDLAPDMRNADGSLQENGAGDLTPFIDTIKVEVVGNDGRARRRTLAEIMRNRGISGEGGVADALFRVEDVLDPRGIPATAIQRGWENRLLQLDTMDAIAGNRTGTGTGSNKPYALRLKAILDLFDREAGIAQIKQLFAGRGTQRRLMDTSKIRADDQFAKPTKLDEETQGVRELLHTVNAPVRGVASAGRSVRQRLNLPWDRGKWDKK